MKILITGATGSLGAYLTRYFSQKGHQVIAHGRAQTPPAALTRNATYFSADITRPFTFPDADVCIHTAALSDDKGAWDDLYTANVTGTGHIAKAAANCTRFIQVSSSSVYLPAQEPLVESIAGNQDNTQLSLYGASKLQSENKLKESVQADSCYILRPRVLYGEGDKVILPRMLKMLKGNTLYRPGSMQVNVSMTHYLNFSRAVEQCIETSAQGIHTYNVADGQSYVLAEVFSSLMSSLSGSDIRVKQIPIAFLKVLSLFKIGGFTPLLIRSLTKNMVLDISAIQRDLNYTPSTNLYDSLPALANWVKSIGGIEVLKTESKDLAWAVSEILDK